MKQSDGGYAPSYNAQISTDAKQTIIVAAEVSQSGSDYEELVPAEKRIEDTCGQAPAELVADGGFTSRANIIEMEQRGVNFIGSMGRRPGPIAGATGAAGRGARVSARGLCL